MREKERKKAICWFTPSGPTANWTGPGGSRKPGGPFVFPAWVLQLLEPIPLPPRMHVSRELALGADPRLDPGTLTLEAQVSAHSLTSRADTCLPKTCV